MAYPAPVWAPSRLANLRAGLGFLFGIETHNGYNARGVNGKPYDFKANAWPEGTVPSEHAYNRGLDIMMSSIERVEPWRDKPMGTPADWVKDLADKVADWCVFVGTDDLYRPTYGYVDLVIYNRRVWSYARRNEGWRPYGGKNPHTDHIHVGQWCPELGDIK